jgi:hypothetical protein
MSTPRMSKMSPSNGNMATPMSSLSVCFGVCDG